MSDDQLSMLHYVDMLAASLQAEINVREASRQREVDQRFSELQEGIRAAKSELNERLQIMNEFRNTIRDREASFLTREVAEQMVGTLRQQNDSQELRIRDLEHGQTAAVAAAASIEFSKKDRRLSASGIVAIVSTILIAVSIAVAVILATRPGH